MTRKQNLIFVYCFMNTIMSLCMALAGLLVNAGFVTLPMYLIAAVESLAICNITTLLFRTPDLGFFLSAKLSGGPETKSFPFWNGIVNAVLNSFYMNTFMTLINVGFRPEYFPAWAHGFPILTLVSITVSLIAAPPSMKFVKKHW